MDRGRDYIERDGEGGGRGESGGSEMERLLPTTERGEGGRDELVTWRRVVSSLSATFSFFLFILNINICWRCTKFTTLLIGVIIVRDRRGELEREWKREKERGGRRGGWLVVGGYKGPRRGEEGWLDH